jgi:FtsP/CotA-like multicopper oxidase with cupredoxin domain
MSLEDFLLISLTDLFTSPIIEARSGDTLQILVHNDLEDEQTSLHWHGLHMRGIF